MWIVYSAVQCPVCDKVHGLKVHAGERPHAYSALTYLCGESIARAVPGVMGMSMPDADLAPSLIQATVVR